MARITIEDCLDSEHNRFALVRLASKRAKQLLGGAKAVTETRGNKSVVSALREIAAGKVKFSGTNEDKDQNADEEGGTLSEDGTSLDS